jgi:hypothetical protein
VTLTITAEQRDALYDQILDRLSGIGDIWVAANAENYAIAERLGREYSDDLRLVLDDLGFGDRPDGTIVLTTPPEVLRRVFSRLREQATTHRASVERERVEASELERRNHLVVEACRQVLADLGG